MMLNCVFLMIKVLLGVAVFNKPIKRLGIHFYSILCVIYHVLYTMSL